MNIAKHEIELILEMDNISEYLKNSDILDYENEFIMHIGDSLSAGILDEVEIVKRVYEYVRDEIPHSFDISGQIVTSKASEVLIQRQGICYAKSHLLVAILRYLEIPAGFCYQKLILNDAETPRRLVLHALCAVYLKDIKKWIRIDARGNNPCVNAQFCIEGEKLAFPIREELGETDGLIIYANPNKRTVESLKKSKIISELIQNLPSEL
ncbi:transglutaminase-like domain-containing protein [Pelosinus baikalensis]|uniref:Transglutaminase-like domain-containing protein n=1 Tax=Pelosinus baikalensis TaxID=2892015 RepID=A0ABS8HQC4_9FIRM|nr:transglutaminase-like domain-containing protein [Pelosinus baikalensis]MCC5465397.1 transglutaminase-like domain-containing protein [Pelosinus baikalensis]